PYKFSAQLTSGSPATGNSAFSGAINFNNEVYDTNNNLSSGVYTAPVDGVYHFDALLSAGASATNQGVTTSLFVNGTRTVDGPFTFSSAGSQPIGSSVSGDIPLTAGQTVDVRIYGTTTLNISVGATGARFSG